MDPNQQDFSIRQNAMVYDSLPGFEDIPFREIGLFVDDYRKSVE